MFQCRIISNVVAITFVLSIIHLQAFNIDVNAPIVKNGPKNSYFGYQVTFHLKNGNPMFLVGAPKDNTTGIASGRVYRCDYDSYPECRHLDLEDTLKTADVDGMWLGGAIDSQVTKDGRAVICGHRYKSHDWGDGQCFILRNDLSIEQYIKPCEGREREKGHEEFGFCQAGVSADFSENNELLIGLPGAYTWKGGVAKRLLSDDLDDDEDEYLSRMSAPSPTKPYSYLGMSVKTAKVLADPQELTFIGGAPRSQDRGQVILMSKRTNDKKLEMRAFLTGEQFGSYFGSSLAVLDVNNDGLDDLVVGAPFYRDKWLGGAVYLYLNEARKGITRHTQPQRLTAASLSKSECFKDAEAQEGAWNCMGSQYGHTLAWVGDVDLDGFQDLAVGAPYEGRGVVYVYKGGVDGLTLTQRIMQSTFHNIPSTFGTSIYGGGVDLDANGYPDIVVGAYASDQVVILRSRPIVGVQHIFQAMPNSIDPTIHSCSVDNHPLNCLHIRVCFTLSPSKTHKQSDEVQLKYKVEAEKFVGITHSRLYFKKNKKDDELEESMKVGVTQQCTKHLVYLKDQIRDFLNPIAFRLTYDLLNPMHPTQYPGQPIPDLKDFPVLNKAASNQTIMLHFKKNCGPDNVCKSSLRLQASLDLPRDEDSLFRLRVGTDKEVKLQVAVANDGEDAHESRFFLNLTNNIRFMGVDSENDEVFCDANIQPISCGLGNPLSSMAVLNFTIRLNAREATPSKLPVTLALHVNTTSDEIDWNDNYNNMTVQIIVETDVAIRGSSVPEGVFYSGEDRGESVMVQEEDIGPEVKHSFEFKNIGNATVAKSNVLISWPYELASMHASGKHLLYIMDPPMFDHKAECFYDPTIVNPLKLKVDYTKRLQTKDQYQLPISQFVKSKDDKQKKGGDVTRVRRQTGQQSAMKMPSLSSHSSFTTLDCDESTAKCHHINCSLGELRQGQSIVVKIRARLWISTFLQEFKDWDRVDVFSKASMGIDSSLNIKQTNLHNDVLKIRTSVQPDYKESKGVAWWVIMLAIVVGVLLLIALILLLWKCGFFKRHRGAHMTSHKAHMLKKQNEEDD